MAVFFETIDKTRSPEESQQFPGNIKEELKILKAELATLQGEKDAEKRLDIQRKVKRLERLDAIMEGRGVDEKNKKDIEEILKGKNADNIKNSDILTLRKKGVDIANLTLVDESSPDKEIKSSEIKQGDRFTVNFGDNKSLRDRTGAGDILPANIRTITINGVVCERKNTPRPGYYDAKGKYRPIYDGYRIEIMKSGEASKEDGAANERQWKNERLEDMIDSGGKALSGIEEDRKLETESQKEIEMRRKLRESIGKIREVGNYGTNKPLGETVKLMSDLNGQESAALARKIFNPGPATDLLITIDGGTGIMIKRMVALGYHEGRLKFGRQNPDPASGFNIGTFQIGGSRTTREDSLQKYESCMNAGIRLAKSYGIDIDYSALSDPGQKDLITHLGYIDSQRGGDGTFQKLRDPSLSDEELITLMHRKIQGGIRAIGESVVAQISTTRIDLTKLA